MGNGPPSAACTCPCIRHSRPRALWIRLRMPMDPDPCVGRGPPGPGRSLFARAHAPGWSGRRRAACVVGACELGLWPTAKRAAWLVLMLRIIMASESALQAAHRRRPFSLLFHLPVRSRRATPCTRPCEIRPGSCAGPYGQIMRACISRNY